MIVLQLCPDHDIGDHGDVRVVECRLTLFERDCRMQVACVHSRSSGSGAS